MFIPHTTNGPDIRASALLVGSFFHPFALIEEAHLFTDSEMEVVRMVEKTEERLAFSTTYYER